MGNPAPNRYEDCDFSHLPLLSTTRDIPMPLFATDEKTGYQVELLEGEQFERFWPDIQAMMRKVPHTWQKTMTLESVYARATGSNLQVWAGGKQYRAEFIFFTQVAVHAAGRNLEIFWGCGEGGLEGGLTALDAAMDNFARMNDCKEILVIGRRGWGKRFSELGFREISVTLSKPVTEYRRNN